MRTAWNKGLKMPSVSEKMRGNTNGKSNKGRKMSAEWIQKLSQAKLGKTSPNKGRKFTPEWIEKIAASKRGKTHTDEQREKNRQGQIRRWTKINPAYELMGRNKKIVVNGGFHSQKQWEALKAKHNFQCANPECGKREPKIKLTRDHVLPLLMGGRNDIENIQPLCLQCNKSKFTQTIRY